MRQAILKQLEQSGLTINQFAKQVEHKVARRTVYAYLRGEEDSLSKTVSILLDAACLTIEESVTFLTTKGAKGAKRIKRINRAKRPRKEHKK